MKNRGNQELSLIMPGAVWVILVIIIPLLYLIYLSFFRLNFLTGETQFVGITNYIRLMERREIWDALGRTLIFAVGSTVLTLIAGTFSGFIFSYNTPLIIFLRRLFSIPLFVAPAVVGSITIIIFNPNFGLFGEQAILINRDTALIGLMVADAWMWTPLVFIVVLNTVHAIPQAVREAASLDTQSNVAIFRYITFPSMQRSLILIALLRLADGLRAFDLPITATGGGPARSTQLLSLSIYEDAFMRLQISYGAIPAVLLLLLCLVVALVFFAVYSTKDVAGLKRKLQTRGFHLGFTAKAPTYQARQSKMEAYFERQKK